MSYESYALQPFNKWAFICDCSIEQLPFMMLPPFPRCRSHESNCISSIYWLKKLQFQLFTAIYVKCTVHTTKRMKWFPSMIEQFDKKYSKVNKAVGLDNFCKIINLLSNCRSNQSSNTWKRVLNVLWMELYDPMFVNFPFTLITLNVCISNSFTKLLWIFCWQ